MREVWEAWMEWGEENSGTVYFMQIGLLCN